MYCPQVFCFSSLSVLIIEEDWVYFAKYTFLSNSMDFHNEILSMHTDYKILLFYQITFNKNKS